MSYIYTDEDEDTINVMKSIYTEDCVYIEASPSGVLIPKDEAPKLALAILKYAGVESEVTLLLDRQIKAAEELKEDSKVHKRREELAEKYGYGLYMYAPQDAKDLIAQIVELEFKLAARG